MIGVTALTTAMMQKASEQARIAELADKSLEAASIVSRDTGCISPDFAGCPETNVQAINAAGLVLALGMGFTIWGKNTIIGYN